MSPTVAQNHRAERRPREHPASEQSSPAPGRRPAGDGGHGRADRPGAPEPAAGAPYEDDVLAVDADVSGAVRSVLRDLLERRVSAAEAVDPLFAQDLAARVARFTENGGKLSRARLVWWALRACGGGESARRHAALRVGAALELIQTCALIHDDVMDGARVRRGRPALHADVEAQYAGTGAGPLQADADGVPRGARLGRAAAILAGDLALAWADDVVADTELPRDTARRVRELWSAMRLEMVAGQYLDVQGEATLARSPARAIRAACLKSALYSVERPLALGAVLADADPEATRALCAAGRGVGLAFQLRDDLLDVFGDPAETGKPVGGDIRSGKPTYLSAVAQARAETSGDRHALAVLHATLGRADASEPELAAVREVFEATGARQCVETKIGRLVARGLRHLDTPALDPRAAEHLRTVLRGAAGTPPDGGRAADGHGTAADGHGTAADGHGTAPGPLLLSVADEGAVR